MTKARPGLKKKGPRPAPYCQRELRTLMHPPMPKLEPSIRDRWFAWWRSLGSRLMRVGR
jgi:hypothetical protein